MGDIGPVRMRYEVLPIPAFGVQDADRWTVDAPVWPQDAAPLVDEAPVDTLVRHRRRQSS